MKIFRYTTSSASSFFLWLSLYLVSMIFVTIDSTPVQRKGLRKESNKQELPRKTSNLFFPFSTREYKEMAFHIESADDVSGVTSSVLQQGFHSTHRGCDWEQCMTWHQKENLFPSKSNITTKKKRKKKNDLPDRTSGRNFCFRSIFWLLKQM